MYTIKNSSKIFFYFIKLIKNQIIVRVVNANKITHNQSNLQKLLIFLKFIQIDCFIFIKYCKTNYLELFHINYLQKYFLITL